MSGGSGRMCRSKWRSASGGTRKLVWLGRSESGRGEQDEAGGKCGSCGRMPGSSDHSWHNFLCPSFPSARALTLLGLCWTRGPEMNGGAREKNLKSSFVLGAVVPSTSLKRRCGLTSNRSITGPILLCNPSVPVSPGGHEHQRKDTRRQHLRTHGNGPLRLQSPNSLTGTPSEASPPAGTALS